MLWIRNDLFRIRLQIFKSSGTYPCYLSMFGNYKKNLESIKKKNQPSRTNYRPFSSSHHSPTVLVQNPHAKNVKQNVHLSALLFLLDPDPEQLVPDLYPEKIPDPQGTGYECTLVGIALRLQNTFIMVSTAETRNCCHSVSLLAAKILKYSYNMSSFPLFEFSATFPPATFSRGTIQEIWPPFLLSSSAVVSSSSS